ncbi:hypothetical protein K491DRAFT_723564 [Lophiostoma macrostomum CBS 122681]|uniref:Uncharacterized protein n=1 Tax=Lophiostoma macrostomum CBS 122681 TaxID=1314788 RepID=A0A6A6SHN9_9PLEO|nr:hypothetical protein K491DRAFT_723564 [Lophiostoma macrostomum CBS 122681]
MRQWGSFVNHNGMSIFYAMIPRDVQLYYGNSRAEPVNGMQWMAFESKHAQLFVKREIMGSFAGEIPRDGNSSMGKVQYLQEEVEYANSSEKLQERVGGWLHEYRTTKTLRVLYLDGMSAANAEKGTLDLQDIVLLNQESEESMISDMDRATRMCSFSGPRATEISTA